jgi:NitT/TauT family transport system ATP-binding protein
VSLDERTADRLRRLLLDVWQARPTTAILVTHNAREAIQLADQLVLLASRPTHVIAVETIAVPQAERDPKTIDAIHADLLRRYPANFTANWRPCRVRQRRPLAIINCEKPS